MGWEGSDPAKWAQQAQARIDAVRRGSAQELAKEMSTTIPNGGRVPVKTGNLARSLLGQVGAMPSVSDSKEFSGQDIGPVLLNWQPGETLYLGYQAKYARRQNYGFVGTDSLGRTYNQSGFGFVEAAAAKWPTIVERMTASVANRTGG